MYSRKLFTPKLSLPMSNPPSSIAALHNAAHLIAARATIAEWAQTSYPALWKFLNRKAPLNKRDPDSKFDVKKLGDPKDPGPQSTYWTWAAIAAEEIPEEEDEQYAQLHREYLAEGEREGEEERRLEEERERLEEEEMEMERRREERGL